MINNINKKIKNVTDVADSIARGNFDHKADADSKDEVGMLGSSMNTVIETLEILAADMEKAKDEIGQGICITFAGKKLF